MLPRKLNFLSFLLLSGVVVGLSLPSTQEWTSLVVDEERIRELIRPNERRYYRVDNLLPSMSYEARISYPATNPAEFSLAVVDVNQPSFGRQLLNTEKIVFETPQGTSTIFLEIEAVYKAVSVVQGLETQPIPYNIVVNTLYFGVPLQALKLGVVVVVMAFFLIVFIAPFIVSKLELFIDNSQNKQL